MFEELHDAQEYLEKAMKLKNDGSNWYKYFYDMGNTEVEHAKRFYAMLNEHYQDLQTTPDLVAYMEPFKDSIDSWYLDEMTKIKILQDMF